LIWVKARTGLGTTALEHAAQVFDTVLTALRFRKSNP